MRTTIVLVHGAFAESASWHGVIEPLMAEGHRVDPLALEPLGPMGPIADADPTSDPLALDPLSPIDWGAQAIGTGASNSECTKRRVMT